MVQSVLGFEDVFTQLLDPALLRRLEHLKDLAVVCIETLRCPPRELLEGSLG